MTRLRRLLAPASVTAAFGAALLLAPGAASTWAHVYLVVVAAGALAVALRSFGRARPAHEPSIFDGALTRRSARNARPEDLEQLERLVTMGSASAFDLHFRLRPAVREIAAGVLLRRGIALDTRPAQARAALGEHAWELLRPDRETPVDRQARGIAPAALDAVLRGIEASR